MAEAVGGQWRQKPTRGWSCAGVTQWINADLAGKVVVTRNPYSWNRTAPEAARQLPVAARVGMAGAIIQHEQLPALPSLPRKFPLLVVKSTRRALRDLAVASRDRFDGKVVAITGTVGKTTSREMLRHVLGPAHVVANKGNNNNLVGVQKAMASTPVGAAYCVVEMGFGKPRDGLARNSRQVRPHVSLVTTIAHGHLDMFSDDELATTSATELVARAKAQMFEGMAPGGAVVLGRDHEQFGLLASIAAQRGLEVLSFGRGPVPDDVSGRHATIESMELGPERSVARCDIDGRKVTLDVPLPGAHMAVNALGVACAAVAAGAEFDVVANRLGAFEAVSGRARVVKIDVPGGRATLIDDHFNATPASMRSGLDVLALVASRGRGGAGPTGETRRIAVLGDFLYMGGRAVQLHAGLADHVVATGVDRLFAYGAHMRHLYEAVPEPLRAGHTEDLAALYDALRAELRAGDVVLLKSGRGRGGLGDLEFRALVEHLEAGRERLDPATVERAGS